MLFRTIRCFYMSNFSFLTICYTSQWLLITDWLGQIGLCCLKVAPWSEQWPLKWLKHKIDLRNGFLRSENLEIVVLHKVLRQIGAKPLQRLKLLAAILDLLQTGLQRALTCCLRSFSKSLWSYLTLCKISKTWPEVHDSYEFPPSYISWFLLCLLSQSTNLLQIFTKIIQY